MVAPQLLSSNTDEWATPQDLFDKLDACFHFIKGRLKFGGAKNPAPFPSAIVIYTNWSQHDD